jgi:hypothetical protein
VPPTDAQLKALSVTVTESTNRGVLSVDVLPNGTKRLTSTTGFYVEQTAVIQEKEKKP